MKKLSVAEKKELLTTGIILAAANTLLHGLIIAQFIDNPGNDAFGYWEFFLNFPFIVLVGINLKEHLFLYLFLGSLVFTLPIIGVMYLYYLFRSSEGFSKER